MHRFPPTLKVGTCSWKYDSWKGLVYSDAVGDNYLSEYAAHYHTVEIDQWFWSLFGDTIVMPKPSVVAEYAASVPKDFRFSIKVPNSITLTHQYTKNKRGPGKINPHFLSTSLFEDFLGYLEPMAGQIDALIFQFEYLNRQKMKSQIAFQDHLQAFFEQCPQGVRFGIETRNQNYLNTGYFNFLASMDLAHVFLQGYWMPSIFDVYEQYKNFIEGFTVIRLHGTDRKTIEKKANNRWNTLIEPKDSDLKRLSRMVDDLISREVMVTLNVNNHYEGSAPVTINRFVNLFLNTAFI